MTQVSSQGDISQPDDTSKTGFDCCVDHQRQCMSNTDIRMDASMNSMEGNNDEMWFLDDDYVVEDEEQLVDKGEHDIPFNVADVPQQLVTADAHTQREVHLGLYEQQPVSGRDHVTKFKASGVKGMQMSTLKSMHDNKRAMAAVGLLRQWHWIMMDGEYTVDMNGANMVARMGPHYLSFWSKKDGASFQSASARERAHLLGRVHVCQGGKCTSAREWLSQRACPHKRKCTSLSQSVHLLGREHICKRVA
ncbi:hypothetical protein EDC04DRAFT_2604202 [Pisolithus marmoratus]|nr:hypothetical protein EDC04DRAFT_2604202 [Pisolithus marmoratus]